MTAAKAVVTYATIAALLIALLGWLLSLIFAGSTATQSIVVSGIVAFAVQLLAFVIARLLVRTNVLAGWGLGMVLRFVALVVYAFVIAKGFGLPLTAALVSLATFFFVSTLVEPWFLKS